LWSVIIFQCPAKLVLDCLLMILTTAPGDSPTNAEHAIEDDNKACKAHNGFVKM
jgi:hypothetical protein